MKRKDIEVGAEYAVLAPSQRDKVDEPYGPNAKHVRVLDTEPRWVERGSSSFRDDAPVVDVPGFGEEGVVQARDRTRPADQSWALSEAGRVVKVLVRREWGFGGTRTVDYAIEVVPTSMVAMTWMEYRAKRIAAEQRREAAAKAREAADKVVDGLRREVKALSADLGLGTAGVSEYRDEVTLTFDQYRALLLRLRTAEGVE